MSIWLAVALGADLVLQPPVPVEGEPVEVRVVADVDMAGAPLTITYRPNSAVEATETLRLDGDAAVSWTPGEPGIAVLAVDHEGVTASRNVSVRFAAVPAMGLLVFLATGLLLFGGATFAMGRLFREPASGRPIPPPPMDM